MRVVHWLYIVSVALFVSGIGFVIASGRTDSTAAPVAAPPPTTPVATVAQIMRGITDPAAQAIFDSVGASVTAAGLEEFAPSTDEEWLTLGAQAAALAESGNLLLIDGRPIDQGDWVTMAQAMIAAAQVTLEAVEAQDPDGILEVGGEIYETCETCHAQYWQ